MGKVNTAVNIGLEGRNVTIEIDGLDTVARALGNLQSRSPAAVKVAVNTDSQELFAAIAGASRTLGHVCAPSLQQKVIARCVDVRPDLAAYDRNRMTLYNALTSYGYRCIKPDGAFYLFVEAPGGSAKEFSDRAKAHNLLIVPGDDFGCPEFFRLCTCVSGDMVQKSLPVFQNLISNAKL